MGIHIGNNNNISNSNFNDKSRKIQKETKKNFWEKHPFLLSFISGLLIFSFWNKIIELIENIFK